MKGLRVSTGVTLLARIGLLAGIALPAVLPLTPARADVVYQTNFDAYQPGGIAGQDGWIPDNDQQAGPQVVPDPTGSGRNLVLCIDPVDTVGFSGAFHPLGIDLVAAGAKTVSLSWDQWRADTGDNVWIGEHISYEDWFAIERDQDGSLHPQGLDPVSGGLGVVPLAPGVWQNIRIDLNYENRTIEAFLDGASYGRFPLSRAGHFRGFDVEEEATPFMGDNGPIYLDRLRIEATGLSTAIPEPSTLGLLALGVVLLLALRMNPRAPVAKPAGAGYWRTAFAGR